ncbi:helicase-related protein [Comamonas thiooxydans]|uniref:helicase-related protein n=1 Tax=Comamonas thiooxydans TaxID=363952 RepID=UPI000B416AA6|nr:helicase-related protein [Comamonas thiooxydans]
MTDSTSIGIDRSMVDIPGLHSLELGSAAQVPHVDPNRWQAVLHKGKALLTAACTVPPVGSFPELELRGYASNCVIATGVVWNYLSEYEQMKVLHRTAKEQGPALLPKLAGGLQHLLDFLTTCTEEGLEPNLDKLRDTWSRGTLNIENLPESLRMSLESLRSNVRRRAMADQISSEVSLADYPETFPAINRKRKLIAVLGPTNSGKTFDAFNRLAGSSSGVYLGPLRLLALEAYNRLNDEFGIKTTLITGEERRVVADSLITASTIEMLNTAAELDVAVVDEIQMLVDAERGWAWTQAVVGANAREIWLLGALSAEPAIRALASRLGLELEIRKKERKNALKVAKQPLGANPCAALKNAQEGDAFIVFSRRDALNLRDDLLQQGRSVACIYGALSPEVREREAHRFSSGDAAVLVATDAVGLGLNLPIRRIIFTSVEKWDGQERQELTVPLLQQIAGRAGRYGHQDEDGIVCGLTITEHRVVQRLMKERQDDLPEKGFMIGASTTYLEKISKMTGELRLEALLSMFVSHADRGDGFYKPHVPQEQLDRAAELDSLQMPLALKHTFAQAPMASNHQVIDATWRTWARDAARGKRIKLVLKGTPHSALLEDAETAVRILAAYKWFAYRLPDVFVDYDLAETEMEPWVNAVDEHLRSRRRQGTGGGKNGRPSWYWG